jgi:hypothetical protein
MPTSYANPAFDEEPAEIKNSAGTSPMGSNIFIVKPDDERKNRSHPVPHRHEPVTKNNVGQTIFRGIRCKFLWFLFLIIHITHIFSSLGNTTNRKRSSKKQRVIRQNDNTRTCSLFSFYHNSMHQ